MSKSSEKISQDFLKAIEPDQSLLRFSLTALTGSLAAIVIAAGLLYFLVIQGSSKQLTDTVLHTHAKSYGQQIEQIFGQIQAQLQTAAQQPELIIALEEGNMAKLDAMAQSVADASPFIDNLKALPLEFALATTQAKAIMVPGEWDMVNRAEAGKHLWPEAYTPKGADGMQLTFVQKVSRIRKDAATGTLLARINLDQVRKQLIYDEAAVNALELQQVFSNNTQTVVAIGTLSPDYPTVDVNIGEHWYIKFQPSAALAQQANVAALNFWGPILFMIVAVTAATLFSYLRLRHKVRDDAVNLIDFCRSLIVGEDNRMPAFGLSLFSAMANTLSFTESSGLEEKPQSGKSTSTENATDTTRANEPSAVAAASAADREEADRLEGLDSLLEEELDIDEDEILDLDLVEDAQPASEPANTPQPELAPLEFQSRKDVPQSIFRAYDIRGIVNETLDTDTAYLIGMAVGSEAGAQQVDKVAVGADGRLSSPELSAALIQGLRDSGRDVVNVGMVPTPLLYFATHEFETGTGVMITGSHNPANYNGFKIMIAGKTLANDDIQTLYRRIADNDFSQGNGDYEEVDIIEPYVERVTGDIAIAKPLKVVVDCGNGVAGVIAPRLLEEIGCDVVPLFCDIDGNFPNHHPDPGKPENLQDLINAVAEHGADLGLAFDGDGDRVGVVTNTGEIIFPDRLMMLFAKDIVSRNPGADIIYDVKCSRRLASIVSQHGGRPIMWKTGHSLIKAKMKETGALLAGEMSGHIFFKERWYGFDDGVYSAARLLELLGFETADTTTVFNGFPDDLSTPELNIEVGDMEKFGIIQKLQANAEESFLGADVSTIDGLRVDFDNGWGLVRASNTTPVLVLRFAADDEAGLNEIQDRFKEQLLTVAPDLSIPF